MSTRIQKIGLANGIKPRGRKYTLSDLIQESYKVSYTAKAINNKKLIDLTESHLANIKKDPTNKTLSEDLDVLKDLVKIGKDQDIEEVKAPKKKSSKRSVNSCVKPMTKVKESKTSWSSSKKSMAKSLKEFREFAESKVFYKEFDKFNKNISKNVPMTMTEAINLYKASNSCLTHLAVNLEKNPEFKDSFKECTELLSRDNRKLLESIQEGKLPSKSLLESFVAFTNILLECDTPEKLDPSIYEDADLEELDDRDVINEDADLEELDDKDVIDEDADLEELDDRDVINEEDEIAPEETAEDNSTTSVDLTPEEISILKSILGKISNMDEEDTVEDEEEVPEINEEDMEDEEIPVEDPEDDLDEEDEDLEDEEIPVEDDEDLEDEEIPVEDDEDLEEEDDVEDEDDDLADSSIKDKLKDIRDKVDEMIDDTPDDEDDLDEEDDTEDINDDLPDDEDDLEEDADLEELDDKDVINEEDDIDDDEEDLETELSESAILRIKKCF